MTVHHIKWPSLCERHFEEEAKRLEGFDISEISRVSFFYSSKAFEPLNSPQVVLYFWQLIPRDKWKNLPWYVWCWNNFQMWCWNEDGQDDVSIKKLTLPTLLPSAPNPSIRMYPQPPPSHRSLLSFPLSPSSLLILPLLLLTATRLSGGGMEQFLISFLVNQLKSLL